MGDTIESVHGKKDKKRFAFGLHLVQSLIQRMVRLEDSGGILLSGEPDMPPYMAEQIVTYKLEDEVGLKRIENLANSPEERNAVIDRLISYINKISVPTNDVDRREINKALIEAVVNLITKIRERWATAEEAVITRDLNEIKDIVIRLDVAILSVHFQAKRAVSESGVKGKVAIQEMKLQVMQSVYAQTMKRILDFVQSYYPDMAEDSFTGLPAGETE